MAAITGITGAVTSWGSGTIHAQLASTGVKPAQFTLTLEGDDLDTTAFSDVGISTHIKGLTGGYFEATGQLVSPDHGANGLVTFTAGYTTLLNAWSMDIQRAEFESTAFGATVKAYVPGKLDWGGDFSGMLDDTTAALGISNGSEPATGTFKYQERGATDNTLSGSIFTYGASVGVATGGLNSISYKYRGSGALTQSSPSTGAGVLPSGAVVLTAAESVVLTASSGRTFSASAFWTSISLNCKVGALTEVKFRGRITGAITIA